MELEPLRYRPLVPAAVAFAAGILAREHAALPGAGVWAAAALGLGGWLVLALWGARRAALAALYAALAAAGWVRLDLAAGPKPPHHLERFLSEEPRLVKVRGTIVGEPQTRILPPMPLAGDSSWLAEEATLTRFDLDCREVECDGRWRATCGRLRVVDHGASQGLRHGALVTAIGTARRPAGPTNPGQIDAAALLRRRGLHGTLALSAGGLAIEQPGSIRSLRAAIYAARASMRQTLGTALSADKRTAALLRALVLGDRTEIDEELEGAFARTGAIHLLAVSGFHVAVVAWVVWALNALAGLGRRASAALVLCAVVAYAFVTGAPPSVVRAAIMASAFVLAVLLRRQPDSIQSVALAAIVLLIIRPFDLFNAGFQLSFVAVLGIICLSHEFAALLRPRKGLFERAADDEALNTWRRLLRYAWHKGAGAAGVSMAAWVAVLPLTAYYFNLFSPITVFLNLLAVPLAGLLTVLGFTHLGLTVAHPAVAVASAYPARGSSWLLAQLVFGADRVPLASAYCPSPALGWVLGYYALALVFVARRRLGLSAARAASVWVLGVLAYTLLASSGRPPKGLELTALDVGHGNATVIRFPDGSTVLYDCGTYGRNDVGRWAAAPALWRWGVRTIDLLVVSHADADHINGIPALLGRFRIGHVVYSPVLERAEAGRQLLKMLRARRIPATPALAGERFRVGRGNTLEVLWPIPWSLGLRPDDQNDNSLVMRIEHTGRRILLGGDIQRVGPTVLIHSRPDLQADVLLVPHHGCAMERADAFAAAVRAQYALCSNRADQLHPTTVAAYEAAGARILATCLHGAITIRIRDGTLEALPWKMPPSTP